MNAFAFHPFAQAGLAMAAAQRIKGAPLTLFPCRPQEDAAEVLEGRDPSVWGERIEPLCPGARQ